MKNEKSKIANQFWVIVLVWISVSFCVTCSDISYDNNGIQARQSAVQRPIATNTTTARPSSNLNSASGNINSSIHVIISTPPTTPSNVNSAISARPAQAQQPATTARPIVTTARPIVTTVRPIVTTVRPNQTTARPNVNATVSFGTTKKPGTTVPVPGCPAANIMATKTGFSSAANDPCSFVSCIRTTSSLFCAIIKCDPGQAFSQQTGRCTQSTLCK